MRAPQRGQSSPARRCTWSGIGSLSAPCRRAPARSARARRRAPRRRPRAAPRARRARGRIPSGRREPGGPEQLVHPRAPDAGDRPLVAQQRVEMARLASRAPNSSSGGAGYASGPSPATASSSATASERSSLAQARCWVPNSRRRSSRPSSRRISTREARSRSDARASNSWRRPADMRWISSVRSPASTASIFPIRRTPSSSRPTSASSGGSNVFSATSPGARADSRAQRPAPPSGGAL